MDKLKVFVVKDKRDKFEGFRVRIGEWEDVVPLKWLLVSEVPKLQDLLRRAYELGAQSQVHDPSPGSDPNGLDESTGSATGPAA